METHPIVTDKAKAPVAQRIRGPCCSHRLVMVVMTVVVFVLLGRLFHNGGLGGGEFQPRGQPKSKLSR